LSTFPEVYLFTTFQDQRIDDIGGSLAFDSDFQYVIETCSTDQLMRLISVETDMSSEMRALVCARDFDLARLNRACQEAVDQMPEMVHNLEEHSYNLSMLNEKLRVTLYIALIFSSDFSNPIAITVIKFLL
jgi:hypothetical protein